MAQQASLQCPYKRKRWMNDYSSLIRRPLNPLVGRDIPIILGDTRPRTITSRISRRTQAATAEWAEPGSPVRSSEQASNQVLSHMVACLWTRNRYMAVATGSSHQKLGRPYLRWRLFNSQSPTAYVNGSGPPVWGRLSRASNLRTHFWALRRDGPS